MNVHYNLDSEGSPVLIPDQKSEVIDNTKIKCFCGSNFIIRKHLDVNTSLILGYTAACENRACINGRIRSSVQCHATFGGLAERLERYTEAQTLKYKTSFGKTITAIKNLVEHLFNLHRFDDENLSKNDVIDVFKNWLTVDEAVDVFRGELENYIKKIKDE